LSQKHQQSFDYKVPTVKVKKNDSFQNIMPLFAVGD